MKSVWREIDGVQQKCCPTCPARGREPWHDLSAYGRDASRSSGISIRCAACCAEDNHEKWTTMKDRSPGAYAAARGRADRYNADHPEKARAREQAYRERKIEAGWTRRAGRWVRDQDD